MAATQQSGRIDFTVMYATHDAFRRDLDRLEAAAAAGTVGTPEVFAGWENFKTQLHIHHSVEDAYLWPRLRRAASGRPAHLTMLDEMEAEHARIDPLLAAVDDALGAGTDLVGRVQDLSAVLGDHLEHEEGSALPLIQEVLTPADWRGFRGAMARRQKVKGAAAYIPWVTDGRPPADQRRFLAMLPAPLRLINRLSWEPRYRRRNLWNAQAGEPAART